MQRGSAVVQIIFSGAPSANVINGLRNCGAALAIIASWALPASAPAAADDKPSGCRPMPEYVAVDTTPPINIGVLANALFYYRCTDYDDQVKTVLNEGGAWVAARARPASTNRPSCSTSMRRRSPIGNRFITTNSATSRAALAI
jgi:hypothetical protein